MNNILSIEDYLNEGRSFSQFTNEQINECLRYLDSEDHAILEAWYNTILDFAALIPGVGSIAEGINLVSYAKQGEYLLAGLCAIGLIPIFGQYIGAGGSILVKTLGKGANLGAGILKPFVGTVAKYFTKIVQFLKSSKFLAKFSGIAPFVENIIKALKNFVMHGGRQLGELAKDTAKIKTLKKDVKNLKLGTKATEWIFSDKDKPAVSTSPTTVGNPGTISDYSGYQIPVPKDAYMAYQGTPLKNIRPYTDSELSQAEMAHNWDQYL